jgi:hypothetical protein
LTSTVRPQRLACRSRKTVRAVRGQLEAERAKKPSDSVDSGHRASERSADPFYPVDPVDLLLLVVEIGLETELEVVRPSSFPSTPVVADCGIVYADSAEAGPGERHVLVLPQPELDPAW